MGGRGAGDRRRRGGTGAVGTGTRGVEYPLGISVAVERWRGKALRQPATVDLHILSHIEQKSSSEIRTLNIVFLGFVDTLEWRSATKYGKQGMYTCLRHIFCTRETVVLGVLHGQSGDMYFKSTHIHRIPLGNH